MYVIVPREVTKASAEVFLGRFGDQDPPIEPLRLVASSPCGGRVHDARVPAPRWQTLSGGDGPPIYCTAVTLPELEQNTRFALVLVDRFGTRLAEGAVETLPLSLPRAGSGQQRPFTVWASSCFHSGSADAGLSDLVERLLSHPRYRPHLKIFLGDQVYLDYPQHRRFLTWGEAALKDNFNQSYAQTWTHPAFGRLLSSSATVCLADDHEFWNNHPNPPLSAWSWVRSPAFWRLWHGLALERYEAIQGRRRTGQLDLPSADDAGRPALSLFFADTSVDRTVAGNFMSGESMAALCAWLRSLECPGVLALGQPLHTGRGSRWARALPGFSQFGERLLPALEDAPHDVVVLAGDSHFGRVSTVRLRSGRRMVELISSPLALVNPLVGGAAEDGPSEFGSGVEGPSGVKYRMKIPAHVGAGQRRLSEEHGLTLSFAQGEDGDVLLDVRAWFPRAGAPASPWRWSTRLS